MADNEKILIEVQFDTKAVDAAKTKLAASVTAVNQLNNAQKELNKTIKEQGYATKEQAEELARINKQLEEEKRSVKSNTAIIQASTQARLSENDSLDMQRQYLNTLQKAYAGLTAEQKEAMGGTEELEKAIKAVSDSLKEQEAAIGDTRRNVGNYAESIHQAFGEMAHAGELISPAVSLLRGMGGEGQKAAAALDSLSKVMQLVGKAEKVLAQSRQAQQVATEGATVAQEGLNAAMNANPIGLIIAGVSTLLPLVQQIISAVGDASDEIAAFNNELERQSRIIDQMQADAAFEAKVAGIMGASAQEQLRIQKDAALKARDIADEKVADLERIMREGNKKEKKAAKEAYDEALAQQKAANDKVTQLNQQATLQALTDKKKAEDEKLKIQEEGAKKRLDALKKEQEEQAKWEREQAINQKEDLRLLAEANAATELAKLQELAEQAKEMLEAVNEDEEEEEEIPTPQEQALRTFGLDEEGLEYYLSLLDQGVDATTAASMAMNKQWEKNSKGMLSIVHNIGNGFQAMGDLMGNFAEESEEAAAAQKAFTLIGILTNQAASISEGALAIAKGVASVNLPFPLNIPAIISVTATIASMIAGVSSSIAQAKQLFSQTNNVGKFAEGGIVPGTSYSGDQLTARVNSREMILPMEQQKVLFDALSSSSDEANRTLGIDYSMIAAANASLPAPVMVYKEYQDFEDKVSTFEEIATV